VLYYVLDKRPMPEIVALAEGQPYDICKLTDRRDKFSPVLAECSGDPVYRAFHLAEKTHARIKELSFAILQASNAVPSRDHQVH